jgi:hypothetical protein
MEHAVSVQNRMVWMAGASGFAMDQVSEDWNNVTFPVTPLHQSIRK